MTNKKILQWSVLAALGTGAYIALVAFLMTHAEGLMGPDKSILNPIVLLLLFVVSAAVTSALVLGKPTLLYLDGKKKEAVELFGFTVGWLVILFFAVLLVAAFLV
jgi:heme O synthase-like polyprenyltransferase